VKTKTSRKKVERISFSKIQQVMEPPDLLKVQLRSFKDFIQDDVPPEQRKNKGLENVLRSSFPISDTRGLYLLEYISYSIDKPRYSVEECIERGLTYEVSLKAKLKLSLKDEPDEPDWKETIEQEVYLGKVPYMTDRGTFIINGAERVIVAQLHRSPGVVFSDSTHPNGKKIYSAKIVPLRGSWIEFVTDINNLMYVYIDQKKKFLATTLLRALGFTKNDEILRLFDLMIELPVKKNSTNEDLIGRYLATDVVNTETGEVIPAGTQITDEHIEQFLSAGIAKVKVTRTEKEMDIDSSIILNTLAKDESHTEEEALEIIYRELRSNEAPDIEAARGLLERTFFNNKKYDLGDVGRYRLNKKLAPEFKTLLDILKRDSQLKKITDGLIEKFGIGKFDEKGINPDFTVLSQFDIIAIMYYLIKLMNGRVEVDDVDHLSNRRVKTVGEQLSAQFLVGLARMTKNIKEKLNARDTEKVTPSDLVNARTISM